MRFLLIPGWMTLCWLWALPPEAPAKGPARLRGRVEARRFDQAELRSFGHRDGLRVLLEGACGEAGDRIAVWGRWRAAQAPSFDGDWDEGLSWRRRGLSGAVAVERCRVQRRAEAGLLSISRDRVRASIRRSADGEAAAVLVALATGDRSELSPSFRDAMGRSGLAHLLVISGLHIGLVVGAWVQLWSALFARWPRVRERFGSRAPAALLGFPALLMYAAWVGPSPSVLRASLMSGALLAGTLARRRGVRALSLALIGCAALDPMAMAGPALQLSVGAVAGITALRGRGWSWLRAGWGASVATAPLTCFWFASVSWTGLPATVLVGPLVAWLLVPGALVAGALELLFGLGGPVWRLLGGPAALLCEVTRWTAELPGAGWAVPPDRAWVLGLLGLSHLALLRWKRPRWAALSFAGLLAACLMPAPGGPPRLVFLPVGHGTAIVVHDEAGVALIDTGRAWATRRVVMPYLRHHGINRLELLVLSHEDDDHAGGADLLRPRPRLRWQGARSGRWGPLRTLGRPRPRDSSNDRSLVLAWGEGACAALLPGDIEGARERRLLPRLESGFPLLAVPHHGSDSSSSHGFLAAVRPRWSVVSVGPNAYGLPNEQTLERIRRYGSRVLRTDRSGQTEARCQSDRLEIRARLGPAPGPGSSSRESGRSGSRR